MIRCGTIRARIMTWVLAVTSLALIAVIVWSYVTSRHRLEAEMEAKARFLADGAARQIDAQLGTLQGIVHGLALALETRGFNLSFAEARALQDECVAGNPGIYGCCIALEDSAAPPGWDDHAPWAFRNGGSLAYEGLSGASRAHRREDWYALPQVLGKPVWSEPYSWNGVLMATYSVPLYTGTGTNRTFAGVVTCDLTLDWLEQMIARLPLGKDGYGMLISRNATYVSHPHGDFVLNETFFSVAEERNDPELRAIGRRMVATDSGLQLFRSIVTHDVSWLAHSSLRSGDWIMVAVISHDEMKASILRLARQQAGIGIAGLLVLVLATTLISRSISRPVSRLASAAETLSAGDLDAVLPAPRGNDEVSHLTRAFNRMRDSLRRHIADLRETTAARERMHSELRIARDIQMGLIPKTFPPFPDRTDLDLHAVLEPAREVGGDFYDFFLLDSNRIVLAIGDVSGKGVPAALFMAVTRSFLRSAFRAETDPAAALTRINHDLIEGNDSCMFVTLFCAVLDLGTGELRYANAGHNPPVIRQPDGRIEWIEQPHGPIAGVTADARYTTGTHSLPADAALVLYTDGVTEAMNPGGNLYGETRLADHLAQQPLAADCRTTTDSLLRSIHQFADGAEQSDDITLLLIRRRQPADAPPTDEMCLTITNTLADQQRAMDELDTFLDAHPVPPKQQYAIRLALEELLTNVVKYAYTDNVPHPIHIHLRLATPPTLTITDDGQPFNPLQDAPPPTLDGPAEDRPIGGLGLHLIQSLGMTLHYRRENSRNILTVLFPPA
ncbi:MAG TPA: SpoIIE family protein phosphatase [Kiritimatiellia bacterium]|jgi:sigma-B regulation protein RsbU (phosphoserine phosphatase)|nr:SpoIIE family protein phosphatase [Kiritimatiellia bacterium]HOE36558.1 SpoIIE family protein phosphatase [Kiritimatiellia bacterium]HOR74679.1 SpoIIE family protein phosphatase [Kiritimatiellia bacterium]HOU59189.1 SpoIIE family protein phosphatase [Kiritimatiellia bacterium]HPK68863.1 SpoIIE family protein phosphatase [Kiritimatiellia bacterium]